jgi:hypothetical protein
LAQHRHDQITLSAPLVAVKEFFREFRNCASRLREWARIAQRGIGPAKSARAERSTRSAGRALAARARDPPVVVVERIRAVVPLQRRVLPEKLPP